MLLFTGSVGKSVHVIWFEHVVT